MITLLFLLPDLTPSADSAAWTNLAMLAAALFAFSSVCLVARELDIETKFSAVKAETDAPKQS